MKRHNAIRFHLCLAAVVLMVASGPVLAEPVAKRLAWDVGGVEREALVVVPDGKAPQAGWPMVFAFHGHGGNARNTMRRFAIHTHWPKAVAVYMQGIPGVVGIVDKEGKKTGWQKNPGDVGDRDLKFYDVALKDLVKRFKIDATRVYAMGHSNGSRFANVLWVTRGITLAAICSSGGQGGRLIRQANPKSIFVIAGEKDRLVPYAGQMLSVRLIRRLLATDPDRAKKDGLLTIEPGKDGLELVTYLHPGGHAFPVDVMPHVVKFFQRHKRAGK